jgi:hypothetical protein
MIIIMHIYNWYHSNTTGIHLHRRIQIVCTWRIPLALLSPLAPLVPLFRSLSLTWNPPCCDRIRPPRSQVACKLTSPFSTLSSTLPPPNSQNPGYQRLTKTTLRLRRLLSGTVSLQRLVQHWHSGIMVSPVPLVTDQSISAQLWE